jgi:hypothetical protein
VLDNCEHLIDAAARMAEALLGASPGAVVLATSREPLRADGEYVYRMPPLALPADDADADDVFRHDAVWLFVTRAHATEPRFVSEAKIASTVAAICRRLDGMPLAIELAAARVASLGAPSGGSRSKPALSRRRSAYRAGDDHRRTPQARRAGSSVSITSPLPGGGPRYRGGTGTPKPCSVAARRPGTSRWRGPPRSPRIVALTVTLFVDLDVAAAQRAALGGARGEGDDERVVGPGLAVVPDIDPENAGRHIVDGAT